jgi:hypothetical protein
MGGHAQGEPPTSALHAQAGRPGTPNHQADSGAMGGLPAEGAPQRHKNTSDGDTADSPARRQQVHRRQGSNPSSLSTGTEGQRSDPQLQAQQQRAQEGHDEQHEMEVAGQAPPQLAGARWAGPRSPLPLAQSARGQRLLLVQTELLVLIDLVLAM